MPPKLALILSLIFIVTTLYLDRKGGERISVANWLPLTWVCLSISKPLSYWLNPVSPIEWYQASQDYLSGNPVDRTVLSVIMLMAILVLSRRKKNAAAFMKENRYLVLLFVYFGISVLWSDYPSISLKRWIRTCGDLLLAAVVVTDDRPVEALKWVMRSCGYVLIPLSVVLVKYFRHLGVLYTGQGATMWSGVAGHKNSLGQLTCVISVFFIWSYFSDMRPQASGRVVKIAYLLMALWLLKGSSSASSMTSKVVFIFAVLMLIGLNYLQKISGGNIDRKITAILISGALVYILFATLLPGFLMEILVEQTGRDMTLTGRTELWADLMVIGMKSPLLGTGYGSFWIGDLTHHLWDRHIWRPTQAHNGYLDIFINLGLVGLGLLLNTLLIVYRRVLAAMRHGAGFTNIKFVLFTMVIVYNMTESSIAKPTTFLWFIFLMVASLGSGEADYQSVAGSGVGAPTVSG